MKNRQWILELLARCDKSIGMEIGVWEGDFSAEILRRVKPRKLILVDPWQHNGRYPARRYGKANQPAMDQRYQRVCERFSSCRAVDIRRQISETIWNKVPALDWVYIDGNHSFEYVLADLEGAHSRLKPGGLIAGDDCHLPPDNRWKGVFDGLMAFLRSDVGRSYEIEALKGHQFVIRKPERHSPEESTIGSVTERKLFVVLSQARSGTHLLRNYLNSHPSILCEGEVFNPNIDFPHLREISKEATPEQVVQFLWNQEEARTRHLGFAVHDNCGEPGSRFCWTHSCLAKLSPKPFLIWLERKNKMAQYASWLTALETKTWADYTKNGRNSANRDVGPYSPDPEDFRKWLVSQEKRRHALQRQLRDLPSISLTYEELCESPDKACGSIFRALDLPHHHVTTKTHKQRQYRLPQLFANFEELLSVAARATQEELQRRISK